MTFSDLNNLDAALAQLSGAYTQIVDQKPVAISLRFTGATRLKIARFHAAVKTALAPYQTASEAIQKQHGGPFDKPGQTGYAEAIKEITELLKTEGGEVVAELPEAEFTRDDNPVPPAVLQVLLPFLQP
jgi:hypothetical protein